MIFLAIGSSCSDPGLASILFVVKKILLLVQIIGPILSLLSLAFHISMLVKDPDDKKRIPKIRNSAIALVILFMIPLFVNIVFGWLDNSTTLSDCWNNASANNNSGGNGYISPYEEKEKQQLFGN